MSPYRHGEITRWTVFIPTNEAHTEPSPTPTWASLTTSPSCCSLPIVLCSDTHQRRGPSPCGPVMLSPHCRTVSSAQTGRSSGRQAAAAVRERWTWRTIHRLSSATSASAQRTSPEHQDSNRISEPETLAECGGPVSAESQGCCVQAGDCVQTGTHSEQARRQLTAGVKRAKAAYAQRIKGHFTSNDPRSMWRGIKCITDYNTRDAQCTRDPSLTRRYALNNFYASDDRPPPAPHQIRPGEEPLRVTAAEVRRTLQRINPRKAAGPDNISGRVLKGCAYQLTEVLTD
ncbi:hypothetical protein L3Q82_003047 [Scortum barcoo]|uniref:Uncharacterized protein n=1 Tax=Scortum barcoo TaxID=214431 RepID=A0ACB8VRC5_9TELE|nr:hypothetical protein L3Q82_003047 [Scortum barcoo]